MRLSVRYLGNPISKFFSGHLFRRQHPALHYGRGNNTRMKLIAVTYNVGLVNTPFHNLFLHFQRKYDKIHPGSPEVYVPQQLWPSLLVL